MDFREWLLNEDPDGVKTDEFRLAWEKGLTFFIFDGYYICAKSLYSNHPNLMSDIYDCLAAVKNALAGSASAKEVDDCIAYGGHYKTNGTPSRRAMELMASTFEVLPDPSADPGEFDDNLRSVVLDKTPEVIMGRIWPKEMVISFWNESSNVMRSRLHILNFVRAAFGGEKEFEYDLEDELMSYDEFVAGRKAQAPRGWDPAKLHTLEPGAAKDFVRKGLGTPPPSRQVDLHTRMKSYTGD